MADTYQEAVARRHALKAELAMLDQFIELHGKLFGTPQKMIDLVTIVDGDAETGERRNHPKAIAEAAAVAIAKSGRPMQRGMLIEAIEKAGIVIHSGDKNKYIGTVMWRNSDRFINVEGQGYWLKGVAIPSDIQAELLS